MERSAGGVVYRPTPGGPEFLVLKDRYGNWGLPKGHVEEAEEPIEAAMRECREETGLTGLTAGPHLGTIDWHFRRRGRRIHKFCDFYLIEAPAHAEPRPQRAEGISRVTWLPARTAVERISYENTREIARRAAERLGHPMDPPDREGT